MYHIVLMLFPVFAAAVAFLLCFSEAVVVFSMMRLQMLYEIADAEYEKNTGANRPTPSNHVFFGTLKNK